jgi:hypothetical protein
MSEPVENMGQKGDSPHDHSVVPAERPEGCCAQMGTVPFLPHEEVSRIEPDEIGVGVLSVVGALCAVVLILIVVLVQAWFYNWKDELLAQRTGPIDEQSAPAAIAQRQLQRVESYGWADAKKHVRAIPIARAMELIVQENGDVPAEKEKTP